MSARLKGLRDLNHINVVLTRDEAQQLREIVKKERIGSQSAWARRFILEGMQRWKKEKKS